MITCGCNDGLAGQADAVRVVVGCHHRDGVVLPTCQRAEVAGGVTGRAVVVVSAAADHVDSIVCGADCRVPHHHGDATLAVHSGLHVGGNTRSWWGGEGRACIHVSSLCTQSMKDMNLQNKPVKSLYSQS